MPKILELAFSKNGHNPRRSSPNMSRTSTMTGGTMPLGDSYESDGEQCIIRY